VVVPLSQQLVLCLVRQAAALVLVELLLVRLLLGVLRRDGRACRWLRGVHGVRGVRVGCEEHKNGARSQHLHAELNPDRRGKQTPAEHGDSTIALFGHSLTIKSELFGH
jgi:hypothetical protein